MAAIHTGDDIGTAPSTAATHDAGTDHSNERDSIAGALERLQAAVDRRPGFGRATNTVTAYLGGGVRCVAVERPWEFDSDLPPALGGEHAAPSPSEFVRAALANCLAMGYRLRAAERGIELRSVRVTVETESEVRGMLRHDADVPPGVTAVRYHVEIDSPADDHEIEALVDDADQLSPVLDMLRRPQIIDRTVSSTHEEG